MFMIMQKDMPFESKTFIFVYDLNIKRFLFSHQGIDDGHQILFHMTAIQNGYFKLQPMFLKYHKLNLTCEFYYICDNSLLALIITFEIALVNQVQWTIMDILMDVQRSVLLRI